MQGQGTDYDYRLQRLEDGFERLSGVATDLHHIVTRLDEKAEKHSEAFKELKENQRFQANQKPTMVAMIGVVAPLFAIGGLVVSMAIAPQDERSRVNSAALSFMQQNQVTRQEHQRTSDLIRAEIRAELEDLRNWQTRQDDRINELAER